MSIPKKKVLGTVTASSEAQQVPVVLPNERGQFQVQLECGHVTWVRSTKTGRLPLRAECWLCHRLVMGKTRKLLGLSAGGSYDREFAHLRDQMNLLP